jgi:hypothetical protein
MLNKQEIWELYYEPKFSNFFKKYKNISYSGIIGFFFESTIRVNVRRHSISFDRKFEEYLIRLRLYI